jgi:tetratricopeptide (TPR) repeat protein
MAVLAVALASGAMLLYNRLLGQKKRKKAEEYREKGRQALKGKTYSDAVIYYLKYISLLDEGDRELAGAYNSLAVSFAKLKAYQDALRYLNKSLALDVKNNELALRWRYECHKVLNMRRDALCDAFLCGLVIKEEKYRKLAQDILKLEAEAESRRLVNIKECDPSDIVYKNYFSTFPRLFTDEPFVSDGLIKLIGDMKYEGAMEMCKDRSDSTALFVSASIDHLRGKNVKAVSALENEKMAYSVCLREYLKSSHGQHSINIDEFVETNIDDPSALYYAAKIYMNLGNGEAYEKHMLLAVEKFKCDFMYSDLIINAAIRGSNKEAQSYIDAALREHPTGISILSLSCEFYLRTGDVARAEGTIAELEKHHGKDARLYLLKGALAQAVDEVASAEANLRLAIEADPKCFKPYIYLGGIMLGKNDEYCKAIYQRALECAVTYEEIFAAEQGLILLEVQNKIAEEYPDALG